MTSEPITRFVLTKDVVAPYKTLEKASEEVNDYEWMRAGDNTYVCKHGEHTYPILLRGAGDGLEIACGCKAWAFAHDHDCCKHVAAFQHRRTKPQKPITDEIARDLMAAGWTGGRGNLRPPELTSDPDGEDNQGSDPVPDRAPKPTPAPEPTETQEEDTKMATEEKKTYTHPDGTEFETSDALLNYIEAQKATEQTIAQTPRRRVQHKAMIKGISPRLQELGRIAVGEKGGVSKSGKSLLPTKLDHFIFTTLDKDENDRYIRDQSMMEMFGDNCTEIPIRLLYNDIELNFPTFYAKYARSGIKIRGDGENWTVYGVDADGKGTREEVFDPNNERGFLDDPDVKPHGILTVLVEGQNSVGGVFKFRTTSWNSINNILSSLALIKNMCGMLTYIPLKLVLRKKEVQPRDMSRKTWIPAVSIEFRGSIEELQATAAEVMRLTTGAQREEMKQIEEAVREHLGEEESIDVQKDIASEFAPEVED